MMTLGESNVSDAAADLAAYAANNDRGALERVLSTCVEPAYAQARRLLGNDQDAADATQEALLALVRAARQFDPGRPLRPWFATIVHRACTHQLRARRRRSRHEQIASLPIAHVSATVDEDAVRGAITELSERDRMAVDLHYFAGLSQAEAAQALRLSENAFAVRLHRAREKLRGLLERRGVTVGVSVAVTALETGHFARVDAHALLEKVHGTISKQPSQWGRFTQGVAQHPMICSLTLGVFIAAGVGLMALSADHEQAPATDAPAQHSWWQGAAKNALRALDDKSSLHFAADVASLRALAAETKPTSLLYDTQGASLVENLAREFLSDDEWRTISVLCSDTDVVVGSLRDDADNVEPTDQLSRALIILHGQPAATTLFNSFISAGKQTGPGAAAQDSVTVESEQMTAWFAEGGDASRPHPEDLAAPVWLRFDIKPLLSAYQKLSPPSTDPGLIGVAFGPQWRSIETPASGDPNIIVQIKPEDGVWTGTAIVRGVGPVPLLLPGSVMMMYTYDSRLLALAELSPVARSCRSDLASVVPATAPARLILGCELRPSAAQATDTFAQSLLATWSGDLVGWIDDDAMIPSLTVIAGLRPETVDHSLIASLVAELGASEVPPVPRAIKAWSGSWPLGLYTVLLCEDRLILTTRTDSALPKTSASGAAPMHQVELFVDCPRLMPVALTAASLCGWNVVTSDVTMLQHHLAPWELSWDDDGTQAQLHERGLPLATACFALASVMACSECHPADEVAYEAEQAAHEKLWRTSADKAAALWRVAEQTRTVSHATWDGVDKNDGIKFFTADIHWHGHGESFSEWLHDNGVELSALAAFFDGATPTAAQIDGLGRYWPDADSFWMRVIERDKPPQVGKIRLAFDHVPIWLMSVPDQPGWWMGFAGGLPVLTNKLPTDAALHMPRSVD
jgi:RNA polymerase sigma-70 factor, ECF subfamily